MHAHAQNLLDVLWGKQKLDTSIDFNSINSYLDEDPGQDFEGFLNIATSPKGLGVTVLFDESKIHSADYFSKLPIDQLELVSRSGVVIPTKKFFLNTGHIFFNIQFGVGFSKRIKYEESSLVVLPFSLIQRNANCVHNGIVLFAHKDGRVSDSVFQISSETCAYYKFDYISVFQTTFKEQPIDNVNLIVETEKNWTEAEASPQPIAEIYKKHDISKPSFADSSQFKEENVTLYGLIDGDKHYSSECITRKGIYPICEQLLLPSYSLAKSIAGTLSLSLIENTFEPIRSLTVAELLTECSGNKWKNVTLEDLSDMSTGNYFKTEYPFDERSPEHLRFIYDSPTSKEKLSIACRSFPKKTKPGRKFIYHTSDTYILGEAMNKYLQTNTENKDYFGELLAPFLRKLGLSYASESTLRTEDKKQQAYTGWGMFLLRDDVPKLSVFLQRIKKEETDSYSFIKEAMRPNKENSLSAIPGFNIFYNNGFWSRRYKKGTFGCKDETWIPFMSGFGGITIVFLPNDMTYYYFSDGYTYSWDDAVFAANKIRPFCEE